MNHGLFPRIAGRERELVEALGGGAASLPWNVRVYERLSSTMDAARNLATELAPGQVGVVLADEQLAGRGRQGRSWFSAKGGFAGTFVFRSDQNLASMVGFSLVVGCVVRDVFQSLGASVGLKWPNDVLSLERRKVCGILIELTSQSGVSTVFTGIGVNLIDAPEKVPESTSLFALSGLKFSPDELLKKLGPELLSAWNTFLLQGFTGFKESWLAGALFSGERLTFDVGAKLISGRMVGVSDQGALLLDADGAIVEVSSGHQIESQVKEWPGEGIGGR